MPPIYARRAAAQPIPPLRTGPLTNMPSTSSEAVTTIFLSNLHCSSCVRTIQDALASLVPAPISVDVSIVTQTVTVRHSLTLSPSFIKSVLDEAGFDIVQTPVSADDNDPPSFLKGLSRLTPLLGSRQAKHIDQCALCQSERNSGTNELYTPRTKVGEVSSNSQVQAAASPATSSPVVPTPQFGGPLHVTLSIGGMTCASCSNTISRNLVDLPGVSEIAVNLLGNSATLTIDSQDRLSSVTETIEDAGYEVEVITVNPVEAPLIQTHYGPVPYRLTLSIGGMTCASCSNTITSLVSGLSGVSDVVVNLLGRSGTALISHEGLAAEIVEAIEDAGYEAEVVSIEKIAHNDKDLATVVGPRAIALRISGMFCGHCPAKVMSALKPFESNITITKPLVEHSDSILRLSYMPDPPYFTIRTLIHAINSTPASSSSHFGATIYHPPSLEDRARHMQAKEQRSLLYKLVVSFIFAIPTFVIAIVYMSLVPSSNHVRMWFMEPLWVGNASRIEWALFILATPVMFYSAGTFHRRSLKEIWALWKKGSRTPVWKRFVRFGSMNLLVSTGVSVAYFASIILLALAAVQEPSTDDQGDVTTYFDSVVFLTMFLLAGRFLEAYSKGRTADAVTALGKLRPATALLLSPVHCDIDAVDSSEHLEPLDTLSDLEKAVSVDGSTRDGLKPGTRVEKVSVEFLEVGDVVRVLNGSSPPSDGTVVSSAGGAFDESSLTGESRLVKKEPGDKVFVGTINKGTVVDVRVDAIGGETMLDHVVRVVREGQTRRAPIERVADLITGYFVPVVTLLAISTWVIWLSLGLSGSLPPDYLDIEVGSWAVWSLQFAIAVFVVACPCGIGLAAPTALLVGSGLAAKFGILVRGGGEAFQEAAQLDLVVFDKTGTLTEGGEPKVTNVEIVENPRSRTRTLSREVILGIAAEIESASSHPLASAIRQYCKEGHAISQSGTAFEEVAGRGVKGKFEALRSVAIIGNEAWMQQHHCDLEGDFSTKLDTWKSEGKSVVLLALQEMDETGEPLNSFSIQAMFAIADPLRSEAKAVISRLQGQGVRTWMISGDNEITAKAVARMVGISDTNVIAGVLPHEKAEKVRWLQSVGMKKEPPRWRRLLRMSRLNERCIVAMVGDGINDAPALTAADVGIAIGSGSDVALSSASFILVSSNLNSLLTLIDLSRTVFNRVKFNFLWASIYNLIAIPIAAGVVYPAGHARLAPVWASLAMALSSVSVVCSSLLLKLYKEPKI